MNIKRFIISAGLAVALVATLLGSRLLVLDNFQGVHGFSIGTSSNYCSVENKLPVFTCEHVS
jgi:hypothetical protein